jgi:transposase
MSRAQQEEQARRRAELIIQVLSGQMKASEAAKKLGVSRKTYYKWEKRFLSATLDALSEKEAGRPAKEVDREKEELQRRVGKLEKQIQILKKTVQIRDLLQPREPSRRGRPPKKRRRQRRSLKQGQLDLGTGPDGRKGGVSGHRPGGDHGLQGHSEASFSGDEPGKDAEGPSGPLRAEGSHVVEDPRPSFAERSWEKKSGAGQGGRSNAEIT